MACIDCDIIIYHTATQEDFDALMIELEAVGCEWFSGRKPTEATTYWKLNSIETCVKIDKKVIAYNEKGYYAMRYPNVQIIKYEAKGCAEVQYVIEFGEYFYKKSWNDSEGTRSIIVTSKVKDANWFSCKENAIEVSKLVGGVVKELTTRVTEVLE